MAELGDRPYVDPHNEEIPAWLRSRVVIVVRKDEGDGEVWCVVDGEPGCHIVAKCSWLLPERRGSFQPVYAEVPGLGQSAFAPPAIVGWKLTPVE